MFPGLMKIEANINMYSILVIKFVYENKLWSQIIEKYTKETNIAQSIIVYIFPTWNACPFSGKIQHRFHSGKV